MPQPTKSARLQLLDGNKNKKNVKELQKRAEKEEKLKMGNSKINAPKWLDKEGKKAFKFLKNELISINLLDNADVYNLALYCDAYSEYMIYSKILKDDGYVETIDVTEYDYDEKNVLVREKKLHSRRAHPLAAKLDKVALRMRTLGNDIGLSPSARAKLAISLADGDEDDEDY